MAEDTETEAPYAVEDVKIVGADPWLETRLDHPEDVAVSSDGTLYAGGENGQLYRISRGAGDDEVVELANTAGFVLGVTLGPEEDLFACDFQRHAVFRLPLEAGMQAGPLETVVQGRETEPPWHPNYGLFDSTGRLYISDSGDRENMADSGGCIYVIEPDGTGHVLTDELSAFPNGLALSPDESTLYVAETGRHAVSAVELDGGETNAIKEVTSEMGLIDGLAVDNDGVVYGASIGDNAIYRMVDGEVETVIRDEEGLVIGNPTNVAVRSDTLYIANLGLWHVAVLELIVIIVDYFRIAPPPGAARTGKSLQ
jgi:sugar lactone lactonase YvrE